MGKQKKRKYIKKDIVADASPSKPSSSGRPKHTILFGFLCLIVYVIITQFPESVWGSLNRHTATMVVRLLAAFGRYPELSGDSIRHGSFSAQIISECTVLYVGALFFSFVLAWPASMRHKIIGLVLGIPVLHTVNIIRLAIVFALGTVQPNLFNILHVYFGQVIMVICVIATCILWLYISDHHVSRNGLGAFLIRFAAYSSIAFLIWLAFNRAYVRFTDHIVEWLFSLRGYDLIIPHEHAIYYQTFILVTYVGLVLAGRGSLKNRNLLILLSGLMLIISMHLAYRVGNVLMNTSHGEIAFRVSQGIFIIGEYLIPILYWLLMQRNEFTKNPLNERHLTIYPAKQE